MRKTQKVQSAISQGDYEILAAFRFELRRFLNFSEQAAKALGMTPQQHQSLLAIRASSNGMLSMHGRTPVKPTPRARSCSTNVIRAGDRPGLWIGYNLQKSKR